MGKYHPHGDQAIYDALARMAQDFSLRYPLIDGHGNFGSPDPTTGPRPRATPRRGLSQLAMELLGEIDEDTVDFGDTYDGRNREPLVVPARFPNLLVNGGGGIAVGMATNIPPHNLARGHRRDAAPDRQPRSDRRRPHAVRAPGPTSRPARRSSAAPASPSATAPAAARSACARSPRSTKTAAAASASSSREVPYQTSVEVIGAKIAELVQRPPHRRHPRRPQPVGRRHDRPRHRA